MQPEDILLWPDGFWCFREDFNDGFMRGNDYRVVALLSVEWWELKDRGALPLLRAAR